MPNRIVVDSGPCIALFDCDDQYHLQAVEFVRKTRAELISTLAVVTEVMYVLDFSLQAQTDFLDWVGAGAFTLVEPLNEDFHRAGELMKKYSDLPMDFTDALLVGICERLGLKHVASVADDFAIYRFKGRGRFVNLFLQQ